MACCACGPADGGADASASAASKLPDFAPPPGFAVMAEVTVEIPMDADEVLARLMVPGGRASVAETVAFGARQRRALGRCLP